MKIDTRTALSRASQIIEICKPADNEDAIVESQTVNGISVPLTCSFVNSVDQVHVPFCSVAISLTNNNTTALEVVVRLTGLDHRGVETVEDVTCSEATATTTVFQSQTAWRRIDSAVIVSVSGADSASDVIIVGYSAAGGNGKRTRFGLPDALADGRGVRLINCGPGTGSGKCWDLTMDEEYAAFELPFQDGSYARYIVTPAEADDHRFA